MSARGRSILTCLFLVLLGGPAVAASPDLAVDFPQRAGTVGDRFPMTVRVTGSSPELWEPLEFPDRIGPFHVLDGGWRQELSAEGTPAWVWSGGLAAYEPGELELPAFSVSFQAGDEILESMTAALPVTIESVLGEGDDDGELADLKDPAAVDPDYGPLLLAVSILVALLLLAAIIWWGQRRYAGRLAAVPQPEDPFKRMAPHEWAYQALQELLRDGHADPAHAGPFFEEIARILKLYLGGRFRIDLMESTTAEIVPLLTQAGAEADPIASTGRILGSCDMVKFAGHLPRPADFRSTVEEAYALVDATRPLETPGQEPA